MWNPKSVWTQKYLGTRVLNDGTQFCGTQKYFGTLIAFGTFEKHGRLRELLRVSGTGTENSRNCRNQQWNLEPEFREF